jgi:ferredoxin-NADP reductase
VESGSRRSARSSRGCGATSSSSTGQFPKANLIFRDELDCLADESGATIHYVIGDHRGDGAALLSARHLRELVPDIAQRDVFLCGPPAMTTVINRNVRAARVPRRNVHLERFALT